MFLGFLVTLLRRRTASQRDTLSGATFGRHYWIVVAIEVVIGLAGIAVVDGLLHLPRATVAWIALVVGLHFFGLATAWRRPALRRLGTGIAACGVVGLAAAGHGSSPAVIAVIAGIVPGALLLGSACVGIHRVTERSVP